MKTKKKSNVVIAIDYDWSAQKVAEAGYLLAIKLDAEITLLHILSESGHYLSSQHVTVMGFAGFHAITPLVKENASELKKASLEFLEKTKEHLGDDSMKTLIVEGDCANSILSAAIDLKADFIVMGSHGHRWLENIVMGSVVEEVLNKTTIPLYIVPTKKY